MAAGFRKGFARVGIGLASTVLGIISGLWFYKSAGAFLTPYFEAKSVANFVAFVGILIGFIVAGIIIAMLVAKMLRWAGLSWLDRIAGGAFGVLRGAVVGAALVMALMGFSITQP